MIRKENTVRKQESAAAKLVVIGAVGAWCDGGLTSRVREDGVHSIWALGELLQELCGVEVNKALGGEAITPGLGC